MKFNDITKAIHDAWVFSWPPIVMCILLFWVAQYLNAEGTQQAIATIFTRIRDYGIQIDNARSILEPYGLTTLIPVVSAIIVVGFLYILNGPVTIFASKLPPHLSYSPDVLLAGTMSDQEKLVLLRKHPATSHFNTAYYMALRENKSDGTAPQEHRAELNYKIENLIKFSVLASLILLIINTRAGIPFVSQFLKVISLVALAAITWCINFISLLRNQEQQFYDEWAVVRVGLLTDAQSLLKKKATQLEKDFLEQLSTNHGKRWWRVYFIDPYSLSWIKQTFITGRKDD